MDTELLSTEEFGVLQTRSRAILVAKRSGTAALSTPTHCPLGKGVIQADGGPALLPWVSMAEALGWPPGRRHRRPRSRRAGLGSRHRRRVHHLHRPHQLGGGGGLHQPRRSTRRRRRRRLNAMLRNPPDFQVMALAGQLRLGLFVVAQLAARHAITVSLTESSYGGVRAIVLIPTSAIAAETAPPQAAKPVAPTDGLDESRHRSGAGRSKEADMSWFEARWPEEDESPAVVAPTAPTPARVPVAETPDTHTAGGGGGQPPLPRRRRQVNLSPQLAAAIASPNASSAARTPASARATRAPELARDTVAAMLRGTRQGRESAPRHRS
ncbi:hypothetical protein [Amycolatopsis vastitatis]|uniref:hypothetical protein n=1 Tax=Amycolatopsis vastitatis TaxID=1905142 RepID=UPI001178AC14|nr:hypothetical protein [Amycolatopsis vastitatis]